MPKIGMKLKTFVNFKEVQQLLERAEASHSEGWRAEERRKRRGVWQCRAYSKNWVIASLSSISTSCLSLSSLHPSNLSIIISNPRHTVDVFHSPLLEWTPVIHSTIVILLCFFRVGGSRRSWKHSLLKNCETWFASFLACSSGERKKK